MNLPSWKTRFGLLLTLLGVLGCKNNPENSVVVYSAADREYAAPILAAFGRRAEGTDVAPVFDIESSKTVGLVSRIQNESSRPRCDVFWSNDVMHMLTLDQKDLLRPITWQIPADWPKAMRSPRNTWLGIAARARVLIVNRERLPDPDGRPDSVMDLIDPKWKNQAGIALPLFGTTSTHFAILKQQAGPEAESLFESIKENVVVLPGNKQVAQAVSSGQLAFGLTDTDDALIEIESGLPVEIIYPDQGPGQVGTLLIPNAVAVIKNSPHPIAAELLANYLVSEDTEGRLAMGPSGQFPVRPGHPQSSRAQPKEPLKWMEVDFEAAAADWPETSDQIRKIFRGQ